MVRRTRDIQKKIWLTPQEERTIAKKMEMIGTENFGAYARKMLIDGYIIVVDYTEQKKLAAEINKIGVNILSQFLIIEAMRNLRAAIFGSVETVDCFTSQVLRNILCIFPAPSQKQGAVGIVKYDFCRVLVNGF